MHKTGKKFDKKLLKNVMLVIIFAFVFSFSFASFVTSVSASFTYTADVWTNNGTTDVTKFNRTTLTGLTGQIFTFRINNSVSSANNIVQVNITNATSSGSNGVNGYVVTAAQASGWTCTLAVASINCTGGSITPGTAGLFNLTVNTPLTGNSSSMWAIAATDNAGTPVTNYNNVFTLAAGAGDIAFDLRDELGNPLTGSTTTLTGTGGTNLAINAGRATITDDSTNNNGYNDTFVDGLILYRSGSGPNGAITWTAGSDTYNFNITKSGYVNVTQTGVSASSSGFNNNRNAQSYVLKLTTLNDELNNTIPQNASDTVTVYTSAGAVYTTINETFSSNGNWFIAAANGNYIVQYASAGYVTTNTTAALTANTNAQTTFGYFTGGSGTGPGLPYTIRVHGFNEIGRMLNINATSTSQSALVSVYPSAYFIVNRTNATANTTYIAANGSVLVNITQIGFVNATNATVITPSNTSQLVVQFGNGTFGNGTVGMCNYSGSGACQPNITFTVKIITNNQFANSITGATVWLNTTDDKNGTMSATDGGTNDTDSANGVIYWALNPANAAASTWRVNVTNVGYFEWNSSTITPNAAAQSVVTSYNNFTLIVKTNDQYANTLYSTSTSGNVTTVTNGSVSCQRNTTIGLTNFWGCPIQAGVPSQTIYANTSMSSGYMNATLVAAPVPANFWSNQITNNSYNNFTVQITTNDQNNNNIYGTGTTNITDVENITQNLYCMQNTTNTYNWGCPLPANSGVTTLFVNVSTTSGYLNYSLQVTPPTVNGIPGAQTTNTSYNLFSVLLTAQDQFALPIFNATTNANINITNVSTSAFVACNKNATNTYNWGCRVAATTSPIVYINITNTSGFMNATNASTFTAPTTGGTQVTVFSNNLYTVLLTARDEFNNLIYSPTATANVTNVIFNYTGTPSINCVKNVTNTSVWGCPVPITTQLFGNATSFNVSATSGYLNYTSAGFNTPLSTQPQAQITNASLNLFSTRIATANEFGQLINSTSTGSVTNVTVVYGNVTNGIPVFCALNATNSSVWGCLFQPGLTSTTVFVNTSSSSGYLNYSFSVTPAVNTSASTQAYNTSFNQFTVRIRSVDNFGNVIYNVTSTTFTPNVTNVYVTSPTINCLQNVTNGDFWGCPLNATNQIIFVNASSASGYLNGTNATTYTTPLTTQSQAQINSSNLYSVLVTTTNQFNYLLTGANNVSLVQFNPSANVVNCVQNATNSSNWGCRANVTTGQLTYSVNMSTSSGYLNYSSLIFDNYAANTQNTTITLIQYGVNVTTTDQLSNMLTNVFAVVANATQGAGGYIICDKNVTNTSVWGCAIPNTTLTATINVSQFGFVNSSTTGVTVPQSGQAPTAVISSNLYTLKVYLQDGTVAPPQNLNATVTIWKDANTRTLFSYTNYNDTNGFYYFPVNASNDTAINATVIKIGYNSQSVRDNRVISAAAQRTFNITLFAINSSDTTPPVITIITPSNTSNVSSSTPTITFTVSDNTQVDLGSISVSGVSGFSAPQNCTGNVQLYTCSFATTALTDGTNYTVTFNARDMSGNSATQQTLQFGYSSNTIITLKLISATTSGVADNTYTSGWMFRFNVTLGTSGNATRFRMNDWCLVGSDCSGNNKIAVSGNVVMNYTTLNGTTMMYNVKNTYNESEAVTPLFDIDATSGIQGNVTIYLKIPTGTNSGSFSTTFAAGLYSVASTGG